VHMVKSSLLFIIGQEGSLLSSWAAQNFDPMV
jgi:hypothetical protein